MEQGDGKLAYGISVQNGRLKGAALSWCKQEIPSACQRACGIHALELGSVCFRTGLLSARI